MSSKFDDSMEALMGKLSHFISTKTVVGEPMHVGDVIIVPLVDVSFGAGAGGYETTEEKTNKDTTGGGLGGRITPSAVIVIINGTAQLINVKQQESVNKLIDMVPGILSKLNLGSFGQSATDDVEDDTPDIIFEKDLDEENEEVEEANEYEEYVPPTREDE